MDEFLEELATLMEKYNIDFEVEESCAQYGGCMADGVCIARNASWTESGDVIHTWREVKVGNTFDASDIRNQIGKSKEIL